MKSIYKYPAKVTEEQFLTLRDNVLSAGVQGGNIMVWAVHDDEAPERCYQPDEARARLTKQHGCPHLLRSLINKLPTPWKLRRNAVIGEKYRCEAFIDKPPVVRRGTAPANTAEIPLDVTPAERNLIPVEGWPDYAALQRKAKQGDHQ